MDRIDPNYLPSFLTTYKSFPLPIYTEKEEATETIEKLELGLEALATKKAKLVNTNKNLKDELTTAQERIKVLESERESHIKTALAAQEDQR